MPTDDGLSAPRGLPPIHTIRTPEKETEFLDALAETASVRKAAEVAGIGRTTVYDWRAADETFAERWDAALDRGSDALEDEAVRRAHEGTLRPVFQGGELVGHVRDYSDTLLIFMLKARRPEKFKDRFAAEHTGKDGGPIEVSTVRERIIDRVARIVAAGAGAGSPG